MARTHIVQAQTALAAAGYYSDKIDGDFGGGSLRAVLSLIGNTDKAVDILANSDAKPNNVLLIPKSNPPRVTHDDIRAAAAAINVEAAMIKALSDIESPKGGFNKDGTPKILFERHKYYQALTKINWITKRNEMVVKYPDICHKSSGSYNERPQYDKLRIAASLNWEAAHESASWGFAQVMGFNWQSLGYESIRDFVTKMYESEGQQLIAACRYIQVNKLDVALRAKNWTAFAKGYNGQDYQRNDYDNKLAAAYAKAKSEGW